ncbi:hypothetical protein SCHPADRAFT_907699 [Schizopora paradoxa]|uniref:Uncharacterized protein n=1 Tax=Schizopora paradoxa TaxID=27342 RepID=A0A0H2RJ73_9AGAM|nr:hypothetical protein SCHPADRAFT_907699 [Schizopora paradoxa]
MCKTSYFVTFLAVGVSLTLNILSITQPNWLTAHPPDIFHTDTRITYGLLEHCQSTLIDFPGPGESGKIRYSDYTCRPFPTLKDDGCDAEDGNGKRRNFCVLWWLAGYASELSVVFGGAAALAIVFAVTTRSRRRRVWRAVASLEVFHATFKILCFGLITDLYLTSRLPLFEYARPGPAFVLNILSWTLDVFIFFGVLITGLSADAGHAWAAGNRAYRSLSTSSEAGNS